jgi:hypothetical protein
MEKLSLQGSIVQSCAKVFYFFKILLLVALNLLAMAIDEIYRIKWKKIFKK